MTDQDMMGLLKDIGEHAETATWEALPMPEGMTTAYLSRAFRGTTGNWLLVAMRYTVNGVDGYDGTAAGKYNDHPVVLRLTRELTERLYKLAEKSCTSAKTK